MKTEWDDKKKILLTGVPETMLQTVFARAQETKKPNGKIRDEKAVELVEQIDYDFTLAAKDKTMSSGVIARTIVLDKLVTEYLRKQSEAVVINLACGLDTRCCRMKGYSHWYNLDLPETMAVRAKLLPEAGQISQIAASAMDETWTAQVETENRPVLVVIEGLTMYLTEEHVTKIFSILATHFPGCTVLVETMNPMMVKNVREKSIEGSHARFTWGCRDGKALEALLPGFSLIEEHSLTEGMADILPVYRLLGKIGFIRNLSNKIIVLKTNPQ